jgi:hypothetical protein
MSFGFGWALPTLPPLTSRHWSEGVLFEVRFLQIQVEKFSVYCYLWCR